MAKKASCVVRGIMIVLWFYLPPKNKIRVASVENYIIPHDLTIVLDIRMTSWKLSQVYLSPFLLIMIQKCHYSSQCKGSTKARPHGASFVALLVLLFRRRLGNVLRRLRLLARGAAGAAPASVNVTVAPGAIVVNGVSDPVAAANEAMRLVGQHLGRLHRAPSVATGL